MLNKNKIAFASILTVITCSFQNCSKVQFSSAEASIQSKMTDVGDGVGESLPQPDPDSEPEPLPPVDTQEGQAALEPFKAQCLLAQLLSLPMMVDQTVVSGFGNTIATYNQVSVNGHMGNLILFGTAETSFISTAENIRGNFIVCEGNIGDLSDARGNVIVLKGDVGDVDDFRGNLIVLGGTIGRVTNSFGNIYARNYH